MIKKLFNLFVVLLLEAVVSPSFAIDRTTYVSESKSSQAFPLYYRGRMPVIVHDATEHSSVNLALSALREDLNKVTGHTPLLLNKLPVRARFIIIAGTAGHNRWIDTLEKQGKLKLDSLKGRWETFSIQTIRSPFKGIDQALVIVGSDNRGTIYGMYDLSAQIGVSPWYWWADVAVPRRKALFVKPGIHTRGTPAVKYRGIFINDEAPALSGWAEKTFGGFNHKFYSHVFELILRLKGNYLWPAMWGRAFNDDDASNPVLAERYGIVMGTSHHEPMVRAHAEWQRYGKGAWNYNTNATRLQAFWRKGLERMGNYENIVTVGMRGDGDEPMTEGTAIGLLEKIVSDQRRIISETTGKPAEKTPQLWALYKEVQEYYDKGMRVPDDITLLLCDDNWGNIRKLPSLQAKPRKGGYGIYYHFDYVGDPRNYKWLNTNQIAKTWEQMHLAWQYKADRIWLVNVGDIKPMELPISFFLDYAWNPKEWPAESLPEYSRLWARQLFGSRHAATIANILDEYTRFNARRKPELLNADTYSLTNYREAERVVKDYKHLCRLADSLYSLIPATQKDAFFQLVWFPVQACSNLNELYFTVAKNRQYARQGRAGVQQLAEKARYLFRKDSLLTNAYNKDMANGKWDHMMDQTHIGYTSWQQPERNIMPEVSCKEATRSARLGVYFDNQDTVYKAMETAVVSYPAFRELRPRELSLNLANFGSGTIRYNLANIPGWLSISKPSGSFTTDTSLHLSIVNDKLQAGRNSAVLNVDGGPAGKIDVKITVNQSALPSNMPRFGAARDFIAMEAAHFTRAVNSKDITWKIIPGYGHTLSAVSAFPVTSASSEVGENAPCLEYDFYTDTAGLKKVYCYVAPTLDFRETGSQRFAISIDNGEAKVIDIQADKSHESWLKAVADNYRLLSTELTINNRGKHTLKIWRIDPGVVLQKLVIDLGGLKKSYLGPPETLVRN